MMPRPRFSLRTLLVVVTAFSPIFAASSYLAIKYNERQMQPVAAKKYIAEWERCLQQGGPQVVSKSSPATH